MTAAVDSHFVERPLSVSINANASCKLCTIRLEQICYRRAQWFRVLRTVLSAAVRVW